MPRVTGYSATQIALHWIVFALIAAQFFGHEPISDAWDVIEDGGTPAFNPLVMGHVAGGMAVLALVVWRLMLRARRGAPPPPGEAASLSHLAAHAGHWALYALMIAMPLSGAAAWFGGVEAAAEGHGVMKVLLLALVAAHVAAALWHQIWLKDGLMARMRRPG